MPMAMNHSMVIGPKRRPTEAVPRFWMAKSASSTPTAIGTT